METETTQCYLGFSLAPGIGPVTCALLKDHFGSICSAYNAPASKIASLLGHSLAAKFVAVRSKIDPTSLLKTYHSKGIKVAGMEDELYPADLLKIPDPPICIYMKGNTECVKNIGGNRMAIVGTRNPTSYGTQIAHDLSAELTSLGWCIVSGLALGIDAVAHGAAISTGGLTVAVLGCGVDLKYPPSNARLYDSIISHGGLVLSEFPPGMLVQKGMFVTRNRLISGLSRGVLVIEGRSTSGSLITARYAGEQGKEVFATPAPITSPQSEAPNILLRHGARLVMSVDDIMDEFNMRRTVHTASASPSPMSSEEEAVYTLLKNEPLTADELSSRTGRSVILVLRDISRLEIQRVIGKRDDGAYYIL